MKTILISSCLLGVPCRWHGRKLRMSTYVRKWLDRNPNAQIISVCPEVAGGLSVPRPPVKRRKGRVWETCENKKNRKNVTGPERTAEFVKGAEEALRLVEKYDIEQAIMCKWSPSCDKTGITGKMLKEHGVEVINTF